jgi:protein SCO1/2
VWFFVAGCAFITLIRPLTRHVPDPPKVLGQVPSYQLTNQDNQDFGSSDLTGSVYVVSFFFTSCVTICPKVMDAMARLQERYARNKVPVKLVSITVDPDNDTPQALKKYAKKMGAKPEHWTFLTGTWEAISALVIKGFKTHMGRAEEDDEGVLDIGHGAHLLLIDNAGGLRGVYDASESGVDEIYHRSTHVLRVLRTRGSCSAASHLR